MESIRKGYGKRGKRSTAVGDEPRRVTDGSIKGF